MKLSSEMCLFEATIFRIYKDNLLNFISKLNCVHIKTRSERLEFQLSKKYKEDQSLSEKIKALRQNIEELFLKLKITKLDFKELKFEKEDRLVFVGKNLQDLINQTLVEIEFYTNRIYELERYLAKATIELESLDILKKCYTFLDKYNLNRLSLAKFNQLNIKVYTTFTKNLKNIENLFEFSVFPNIYQTTTISDDRIIIFVVYPKDRKEDLKERVNIIHAEEVNLLKKYLLYDGINFIRINKEIKFIEKTISKYKRELDQIRNDNILKFAALNEIIQNIEEYSWADRQFEELSSARLNLNFFIPKNKKKEVHQKLSKEFKDKITIEITDIKKKPPSNKQKSTQIREEKAIEKKEGKTIEKKEISDDDDEEDDLREDTPRAMHNFFLFRPFETLTRLYGTPSYSEIDPTPFLFFTFPLLFGMMFGDIGHGICLIIAGLIGVFLYRKKKGSDTSNFCWIIFWCGWGAILFGFLYGEFFGTQEIGILGIELTAVSFTVPFTSLTISLHNPIGNIMTLFIFAILVGVVHINLGWFIQFLNYWRQSRKYLAFTDSLCKISLLTGGTCLIFIWGLDIFSWFAFPFPILLVIIPGLLLIFFKPLGKVFRVSYLKEESVGELLGEGSLETFETALSVLSNVASYVRLLALALAHIALMISIQAMVGLIEGEGIGIQILIVICLIFGNLIVILIEGILVFINAIRLHFYEFFFKFYQGTGITFFPFFLDEDYSRIIFKITKEKDIISEEIAKEIDTEKGKKDINNAMRAISKKFL